MIRKDEGGGGRGGEGGGGGGGGGGGFFFFKQKTAYEIYQCDWSSDVCSSDLPLNPEVIIDTEVTDAEEVAKIIERVIRSR